MTGKTNTDNRQIYTCIVINNKVKVAVILSMKIFSIKKLLHTHVQYVFNESSKYQNLSTNSLSQDDYTMFVLSQMYMYYLRAYKTEGSGGWGVEGLHCTKFWTNMYH